MSTWLDEIFEALEVVAPRSGAGTVVSAPTVSRGADPADPPQVGATRSGVALAMSADAFAGELTLTQATLVDVTRGDRLGRLDSAGDTHVDVRLDIPEDDARDVARRLLERDGLALRWVLSGGGCFDVDTASGDLTVDSVERLQVSVRLPSSWLEQDRSVGELLAETRELSFVSLRSSP